MSSPELKICGLRRPDQAIAIASLGVEAIGVIGVRSSPRFVPSEARAELFAALAGRFPRCRRVLVVADPKAEDLPLLNANGGHSILQLHGEESPACCSDLRSRLGVEIWKALRIRSAADLLKAAEYEGVVDALLLDAWAADQLGGTGRRLPLEWLEGFSPQTPWWLAGGVSPEGVPGILQTIRPVGLDVSSSVEDRPGEKNLRRVEDLVRIVRESTATPAA